MSDSYLLEAGWWFFAAWSVIVAVVSVAAFGRDLLPSTKATEQRDPSSAGPESHAKSGR